MKKELEVAQMGLHEMYEKDPIQADLAVFGRESDPITRRGFLKKSSLLAMAAVVGSNIPFADNMPSGLIPAALANSDIPFSVPGKDGLIHIETKLSK